MPFVSEAQRRKFGEFLKQGKITQKVFDEWNKDVPAKLPERVKSKSAKPVKKARAVYA